ncbi:MAG: hypothetical protein AAB710_02575, partial [Patescibacteria group bacterium]
IVVGDNSKSIPAGLSMRIWDQSSPVQFYYGHFDNNYWSIDKIKKWPAGCVYSRSMNSNASALFHFQEKKESLSEFSFYWNYILGIRELVLKNQKSRYNDRKNQEYRLEAKYHTISPWDYSMRTPSAFPGVLVQETKEKHDTWKKSPLSIELTTSAGGLRQDPEKLFEETVVRMLDGLPEEIHVLKTLSALFSFRSDYTMPYNVDGRKAPLVPKDA